MHDNSKSTYLINMKLSESILIGMGVNWLDFGISNLKFEKMVLIWWKFNVRYEKLEVLLSTYLRWYHVEHEMKKGKT